MEDFVDFLKQRAKQRKTATSSERGPDDDLRLQFEALTRFTPEEKKITKAVLESLIIKHDANRFSATG